MVATESVTIRVPVGMSKYLKSVNSETYLLVRKQCCQEFFVDYFVFNCVVYYRLLAY